MARPAKQFQASQEERLQRERLLNKTTPPVGQHLRSQLVLHCMDGKSLVEIAAINKVSPQTLRCWRDRYIAHGREGLCDRPRSGRPSQYTRSFQETLLHKLEEPPPAGHGC